MGDVAASRDEINYPPLEYIHVPAEEQDSFFMTALRRLFSMLIIVNKSQKLLQMKICVISVFFAFQGTVD